MSEKRDTGCLVVAAERIDEHHYRLRLKPNEPFAARPGQFVMVRVRGGIEPLLRRPFSIHRFDRETGEFEVLFRVVGKGTDILAGMREGDGLDVLAPLGSTFGPGGERPLLVGGGIGVAPLLFLAEELTANGKNPKLLLGGRSDRDLLCHGDFECIATPTVFATEDGSAGHEGLVTAILAKEIEATPKPERSAITVHSCGPVPMLAAVARLCQGYDVKCEVSLEAHMACGVGACLGCIVKSNEGDNLRVCKEGPVFDSNDLWWP